MSNFNRIFSIIALLCLADVQNNATAAITSFNKSHNYPRKHVMYYDSSFNEGNLVYAVCDGSASAKNCMIIHEHYPDGKTQRSCNITLDVYQENANITEKIYTVPFGTDRVLLFWDEIGSTVFFKAMTIQMDSCQTDGSFAVPDPSKEIYNQLRYNDKIVTYNDTFEIFIKNDYLSSDGSNDTESVITLNSRGLVEKSATDFMKNRKFTVRRIAPIGVNSPKKSYVYSKELGDRYVLAIRKPDGSDKVLASHDNSNDFFTSMANDLVTLCVRSFDSSLSCKQYDKETDVKLNITFDTLDFGGQVIPRVMYNVPGGGFLIVFSEYVKSSPQVNFGTIKDYSVIKVAASGDVKPLGIIHLKDLVDADNTLKALVSVKLWKNGNEKYCAAVIGQGVNNQTNAEDEPTDLSVTGNCFTEADFE